MNITRRLAAGLPGWAGRKGRKTPDDAAVAASPGKAMTMIDRSSPRWATVLGAIFTLGGMLCFLALAILGVFFVTIVAEDGETGMVPVLTGLGATFALGMLVLEYAHARALAGFRQTRTDNDLRTRAGVAVMVFLVFTMVHPLLGAGIPLGVGIGALIQWILSRRADHEPLWDFLPNEAVSVLSGRDATGLGMVVSRPRTHALAEVAQRAAIGLSAIFALAAGSWLAAENTLAMAGLVPLVLATVWTVDGALRFTEARFASQGAAAVPPAEVRLGADGLLGDDLGLTVRGLTVRDARGRALLSDINFEVGPGSTVAVMGESGAGKSLLLRALVDPFSLDGMDVSGTVLQSGTDLWLRRTQDQSVPAVLLPEHPVILPASGADNLSCFHDGELLTRGKRMLEQFVFAGDMVDSICAAPDARILPSMQRRTLALARAFLLGPQLYLMDRPEDGLPEKQVSALLRRIDHETRLGRSVFLVTEDRALLESCDRIIILQEGRIVDYGQADQVRRRVAAGWARFIGARALETEDNLENWMRSHFRRDGDESNRRKVCMVASEMLAFSCQSAEAVDPGNVSFMFKHFEGHCIIRMQDGDSPISTAQLRRAEAQARREGGRKMHPLATIVQTAMEVDVGTEMDNRVLEVKIETYDPRKSEPKTGARDDEATA